MSDSSSLTTEVDPLILPLAEQILRRPGGVVAGGWRRRLGRVSGPDGVLDAALAEFG